MVLQPEIFNYLKDDTTVFEKEPLEKDNKLWNMENVIITPHNSFVGEGNGRRLSETIMSNLYDFSIGVVQ